MCFKRIPGANKIPLGVQYFADQKSWIQTHIMEAVLTKLNKRLLKEGRSVVLFLDKAACHPNTLGDDLSNINVRFLQKNTTSSYRC